MSAISCQQRQFGTLDTGQAVTCYNLRNTSGMTVSLLNYGAILSAVQIPDLRGEMHEITLGPSQLEDLTKPSLSGATVVHIPARYGINFNTLNQTLWEAESTTHDKAASVKLSCEGVLDLKYSMAKLEYRSSTEYTLTATDELIIRSQIETSLSLPLFITHHPIWNLTGGETKDVSDHILQIFASRYAEIDKTGFISSEYLDTLSKPAFNFQQPQRIGEKWTQAPKEMPYDVCFKLTESENKHEEPSTTSLAAHVKAPVSGRILEFRTTQPGLRFSLKTDHQSVPEGFCLSAMPLLHSTASRTETIQQETRYKLVW